MYKKTITIILLIAVTSCGELPPRSVGERAMPGIHIDMTVRDTFKRQFHEVQECTGIYDGTFESLAVVVMPLSFPCNTRNGHCSGEFVSPNIIKIGLPISWKHEVIHALLNIMTGDPDPGHKSPFFRECVDG